MADDRKTAKHRGVKFLEQQPVTDHMLDVVAHRGEQADEKVSPIVAMLQRRESDFSFDFYERHDCLCEGLKCQK
jgi:hypothetical protein